MNQKSEIEQMIGQPNGERLEYRPILITSKSIAELICAFANTNGGYIVFGVTSGREINGLSADFFAESAVDKAMELLNPRPTVFNKYILYQQKKLYVIEVEKSEQIITLSGKKYIRVGCETKLTASTDLKFTIDGYAVDSVRKSNSMNNRQAMMEYHAYDIDLNASFKELTKQVEGQQITKAGMPIDEYLALTKSGINSYCSYHELGNLESNQPLILRYPAYNYSAHLAFQLMTFDIHKIHGLLDFQHENYLGLDQFQKIVEHGVYDWVKRNSPFDNSSRLQRIMEWVEKRKGIEYKRNKTSLSIGNKILNEFKKTNSDVGDIVMLAAVTGLYNRLTPPEKKEFNLVFKGMVDDGYISYDSRERHFIRLGERGYRLIYDNEDNSASDVQNSSLPIVVLLTALKEEYSAVRAYLTDIKIISVDGIRYEEGVFLFDGQRIATVIIRECGPRNPTTAQETQRAITNFHPQCMFFIGIAGSRKPDDFSIGDVIFPDNVHYYEGGKSELTGFTARPDDVKPTYTLFEIAKMERHRNDWKTLLKNESEKGVRADIGTIASGEKVVEHYDSEIGKIIAAHYSDTSCIAMEEYGFLKAIHNQGVGVATMLAGVVRGVSDILERSTGECTPPNSVERRPAGAKILASNTAAAFAYWIIIKAFQGDMK